MGQDMAPPNPFAKCLSVQRTTYAHQMKRSVVMGRSTSIARKLRMKTHQLG
ncbi:hypothetical protein DPMN_177694 [Dreissena polymorpha]|uniref:Uncharacterized protein n=1 Tax=Dreissena polymorpha TaxID=45954 RepID=A0A9D4E981_DREPO|nr:hypothetical protein DPMN_177694 [Dreissena polymorpha]